jgi:hypothetical protein
MALHHLGIEISERRLQKLLRVGPEYTPFSHLRYLEQLGLSVTLGSESDVEIFATYLAIGLPVIVGVRTLGWPHWDTEVTEHAVVVVGIDPDQDRIYINDPFFPGAPIEMQLITFQIGWEEKERQYAIIGLVPP